MSIICPKDPKGPAKFRCAQGGCQECLEALMERHEGLVHSVLRQQSGGELSYEELLQAGRIGLWRAVLQFDTRRGVAFSTYAWTVIKRKIWQEVTQSQKPQGWLKPESPPDPRELAEERLWWEEVYLALVAAVASLPPRQQEVIRAVCGWEDGRPRSLVEIGRQWGVTRQAATYWYYKALVSLRLPAVPGHLPVLGQGQPRGLSTQSEAQSGLVAPLAWREGAMSNVLIPAQADNVCLNTQDNPFQRLTVLSRTQLAATRDIPAAERRLLSKHFVSAFRWKTIRQLLPLRLVVPPDIPPWHPRHCRSHYRWLPPDEVQCADDLTGLDDFDLILRLFDFSPWRPIPSG